MGVMTVSAKKALLPTKTVRPASSPGSSRSSTPPSAACIRRSQLRRGSQSAPAGRRGRSRPASSTGQRRSPATTCPSANRQPAAPSAFRRAARARLGSVSSPARCRRGCCRRRPSSSSETEITPRLPGVASASSSSAGGRVNPFHGSAGPPAAPRRRSACFSAAPGRPNASPACSRCASAAAASTVGGPSARAAARRPSPSRGPVKTMSSTTRRAPACRR